MAVEDVIFGVALAVTMGDSPAPTSFLAIPVMFLATDFAAPVAFAASPATGAMTDLATGVPVGVSVIAPPAVRAFARLWAPRVRPAVIAFPTILKGLAATERALPQNPASFSSSSGQSW